MTGRYVYLGARVLAAIILLQTLFFKFSASHESVFIFTKIGAEPWGRIGIGVMELLASVLMLVPFTALAWFVVGHWLDVGRSIFSSYRLGHLCVGRRRLFVFPLPRHADLLPLYFMGEPSLSP